jgi:hypothetical protein
MNLEEIQKYKQSTLKGMKGPFTGAEAQVHMAAAMWEIAAQLAVLNEREEKRLQHGSSAKRVRRSDNSKRR